MVFNAVVCVASGLGASGLGASGLGASGLGVPRHLQAPFV